MIITILKAFQSDQFQYHKKSSQSLFTEKLLDKKNQVQVLTGILYSEYSVRLICLTLSRLVSSFIYVTNFPYERINVTPLLFFVKDKNMIVILISKTYRPNHSDTKKSSTTKQAYRDILVILRDKAGSDLGLGHLLVNINTRNK